MERALNPDLLRLALGQHDSLPSPEELSEILARVELGLLLRNSEPPEELKAIGWYLHGVASSKYALQVYGIERQRAAFQVAGHIFDLLLHSSDLERIERFKYCFAAQIAYLRSELTPNALAIYQRFGPDLNELSLLSHFEEVALSCGVAFLGLNVDYVFRIGRSLREEIGTLISEWQVQDIFTTPFGAAAGVALGTRNLLIFLVYGRTEALSQAREQLRLAVLADSSSEDELSRWVAAHLLNLSTDLENASIWTVLPPEIPDRVRKAFAMGTPKILTLWPPQLRLLNQDVNPLSPQVKRFLLSTPTSGGKTLLAQLLIVSHLATAQTSVCYVAPTRSLCREVRKSLESRLRYLSKQVVDNLPEGDWLDAVLDFDPNIEVMTPERLSYLLRTDSERLLQRFGMFIFDEVHAIGESGRGWTLEEDLTFLHYNTQRKHHRIILISAVIGNRNHFVQWMNEEVESLSYYHTEWRGPRRLHAIWSTEVMDWEDHTIEPIRSANFRHRIRHPLYGRLDVRISHTGDIHHIQTTGPIGDLVFKISTDNPPERVKDTARGQSTPFYIMTIPVIQHLADFGSVLIIESTRPNTVRMAQAIADNQEAIDISSIQPLIDLVEAHLSPQHPLGRVLRQGVAYHHGGLPSEIREAIEDAVVQGNLRFLVATTTMTEGVNLPVRSVVIASQGSHGEEGYREYITGPKLLNAIGRAGRATKETEGIVVLARNAKIAPADFNRLTPDETNLQVISMLASQRALADLAAFEEFQRDHEDAIFEVATGMVPDFIKFIWFICAELEKSEKSVETENIQAALSHTFGWVQLTPANRIRWATVAEATRIRYANSDPTSRQRWAASGTTVSSAWLLEQIVHDLVAALLQTEIPQNPRDALDIILGRDRLQRILSLPEAVQIQTRVYNQRAGKRQELDIPIREILFQWLQGAELVSLADTFFGDVNDVDFRFEQLGDFINQYFEVYFPWVMATIINWTNSILQTHGVGNLLPNTIPANVRWGVGDSIALRLMVEGIQSRQLAMRISAEWQQEENALGIREWLQSMGLDEWQKRLEPSVGELRNLLEYSRNPVGGVAVALINDEVADLEVDAHVVNFPTTEVHLRTIEDTELSPIGIWARGEFLGQIRCKDQADIRALIKTGLPISIQFAAQAGSGLLTLRLIDPAA